MQIIRERGTTTLNDERKKRRAIAFIQSCWIQVLARKEFWRFKQEAYKTSIVPMGHSRINHLEERGNDTIQEKIEERNLDSSVIVPTVQFYSIKHNS